MVSCFFFFCNHREYSNSRSKKIAKSWHWRQLMRKRWSVSRQSLMKNVVVPVEIYSRMNSFKPSCVRSRSMCSIAKTTSLRSSWTCLKRMILIMTLVNLQKFCVLCFLFILKMWSIIVIFCLNYKVFIDCNNFLRLYFHWSLYTVSGNFDDNKCKNCNYDSNDILTFLKCIDWE